MKEILSHTWMSPCRNKTYNILNYDSFKGEVRQTAWDILHVGATVEMFARLASLKSSEGVFN
ncbi:hypothetical protein [Dysgonomonas termitidis]|uniref:Uncharacterized protein n=1 Tax=Dysgonomonas termitidis TaxID=1516126 RepID=A0ABV9KQ20_9BACT